jgi:CRISPR system Cascade subunit CasD
MRDYLLFRLYGPMASWGDIAVGEFRPSFAYPTKSAILGLLAAAKGILRCNEDGTENQIHGQMAESYGFAFRVETPGILLRDYHTIQVPGGKDVYYSRREELDRPSSDLNTILSSRDYRCEALYSVCVWCKKEPVSFALESFKESLIHPHFVLYLGRKSCPIAIPLEPQINQAHSIREAFQKAEFKFALPKELELSDTGSVYWEGDEKEGFEGSEIQTTIRRDVPLSRRRWQFEEREEHLAIVGKEG